METNTALAAFAALSQPTRLEAFRLLIRVAPDGLPSGEIGRRLGVRANTISNNLAVLAAAGLIRGDRDGKTVRYSADMSGVSALLAFLMSDCCQGRRDLCQPAIDAIACNPA